MCQKGFRVLSLVLYHECSACDDVSDHGHSHGGGGSHSHGGGSHSHNKKNNKENQNHEAHPLTAAAGKIVMVLHPVCLWTVISGWSTILFFLSLLELSPKMLCL